MTNFTLNQQDTTQLKRCIKDLLVQMTTDYQQTQSERREVAVAFPATDENFSIIEELELITTDLRGYASQLQFRDWIEDSATAIDSPEERLRQRLQSLRLFSIPHIAQFYFENSQDYPKLKEYMRQLDYIRLLLLEYLQSDRQTEAK
jgi:hypothetical protein